MFNIAPLYESVATRIKPPVAVILGSPRLLADLIPLLPGDSNTCFQLDLHQADKVRDALAPLGKNVEVVASADLWDLEARFQTVLFPIAIHGERELKLDLIEQAYQILLPGGTFLSLSEYRKDQLLPKAHKNVFGKTGELPANKAGSAFWSTRGADQPKRRHEVEFHAKIGGFSSKSFISRPGVFSYGRLDDGARALLEAARIHPGDRILDLGCGVGANGILASDYTGPEGHITFVDSNLRAVALAAENARANGLTRFDCHATYRVEGLQEKSFDAILANPPYYAQSNIAKLFIDQSLPLLKPGGRFHLVTRMPNELGPWMVESFPEATYDELRGYVVFTGIAE